MATSNDMQTLVRLNSCVEKSSLSDVMCACLCQFTAGSFQDRSRATHAQHCALLSGPLRDHAATAYGILRDSILNQSNFFHVTEGLVPDIMHDVLEGCAPYEVKELLKYLQEEGFVNLQYVNEQIQSFAYAPPDVRNKPTPIPQTTFRSLDHSVKQKGLHFL